MKATLAVFSWGGLLPETHGCIVRDIREWPELRHYQDGDALIDRARCRAASDFLIDEGAGEVLLMVDHDMEWRPGDLQRIAVKAIETRGVVAGVYSKRAFGGGVAVRFAETGEHVVGSDRLVAADYVSTGFMAIPREVLVDMATRLPMTIGNFQPFFIPVVAGSEERCEYLSEDWAFCWRVRESGFPVYADLYPRLVHHGEWGYRVMDSLVTMPPDQPATMVVRPPFRAPALAALPRDVAEYTGAAPDAWMQSVREARRIITTLWENEGGFENEEEWYQRLDVGRAYIFDLAGSHLGRFAGVVEEWAEWGEKARVLDFGAGIGTLALALAGRNWVDTVEVNEELNTFARFRAERMGVGLNQLAAPHGEYDLAVCWHVLEHIPDPEGVVKMISSHVKEGGLVLTESDFHTDPLHPMHHEGVDPDELWRAAGLVPEGGSRWRKPA